MSEEDQIQKGFNAGYQLQQVDPHLTDTFLKSFADSSHPYVTGFQKGTEQFTAEKVNDKSNISGNYYNKIQSRFNANQLNKDADKSLDL